MPIAVKRGRSGNVRKTETPAALLEGGGSWISRSGRAILRRRGRGKDAPVEVAFALVDAVEDEKRFDMPTMARRAVERQLGPAIRDALQRAMRSAGVRLGRALR